MDPASNLTGKMLIAMPSMSDPRFERSVILVCTHSDEGAMGLMVNRTLDEVIFKDLLIQLGIDAGERTMDIPVRFGGPVEPGRGFVLHTLAGKVPDDDDGSMRIGDDLAMTTTRDILEDFAMGRGPQTAVLALGYAGWGPGQLDDEIRANGWLTVDRDNDIIFGRERDTAPSRENDHKWQAALAKLGVNPLTLSPSAGRA